MTKEQTDKQPVETAEQLKARRGDSAVAMLESASGQEREILSILLSYSAIFTNRQAQEATKRIMDTRTRSPVSSWDEAIKVVEALADDYIATAAAMAEQTGNDDGTDVFTANAGVAMAVIDALQAARSASTPAVGADVVTAALTELRTMFPSARMHIDIGWNSERQEVYYHLCKFERAVATGGTLAEAMQKVREQRSNNDQ